MLAELFRFGADKQRQRQLLSGLDALPGQQDLFDVDGESDEPKPSKAKKSSPETIYNAGTISEGSAKILKGEITADKQTIKETRDYVQRRLSEIERMVDEWEEKLPPDHELRSDENNGLPFWKRAVSEIRDILSRNKEMTDTKPLAEKFAREFATRKILRYAKDAAGHEHKGKGPGGGQFTSGGGGGAATAEPASGKATAATDTAPQRQQPAQQQPAAPAAGQQPGKPAQQPAADVSAPTENDQHTAPPPGPAYRPDPAQGKASRVGVPGDVVPPPPSKIPRLPNLSPDERRVEQSFASQFESNPDGMADDYLKMVYASDSPKKFETDAAKNMSTDWTQPGQPEDVRKRAQAEYNTALHQTANAVTKRAFMKHLDTIASTVPEGQRHCLVTAGGCGCHGIDTPVLMFDGTTKMIQDVETDDRLIGPDSKPRTVLWSIRGQGRMYRITPTKGESFTVNEDHVLSLASKRVRGGKKRTRMQVVNLTVAEVLARGKSFIRNSWLYRAAANFEGTSDLPLDPYFLGLWLGDGTHSVPAITSADPEIAEYMQGFAESFSNTRLVVHAKPNNRASVYQVSLPTGGLWKNPVTKAFCDLRIFRNKHIPQKYLTSSREHRLAMLAGLVDSDGYVSKGYVEILTKIERLSTEILFLARSLGFGAYAKPCRKTNTTTGISGDYFRISISGDLSSIPTKVSRKQSASRKQIKSNGAQQRDVLKTGYRITELSRGDYYGFTLDGDGLYLLGDFTVTHNSGKGYALKKVGRTQPLQAMTNAIWDSAGDQNSTEMEWIHNECKKRGIKMTAVYVHNDPEKIWNDPAKGVVFRAGQEGRMVDARVFADSHTHGARNFQKWADKVSNDPSAEIVYLDNNRGAEPAEIPGIPPEALNRDPEDLYAKSMASLEASAAPASVKRGGSAGARIWP